MAHAGDVGKRERTTTTHHEWTPPGVRCSNEERRQGNELRGRVQDGGEGSVPADSPPLSTYKDGKRERVGVAQVPSGYKSGRGGGAGGQQIGVHLVVPWALPPGL